MNNKVTVIIPAFNEESTIQRCVDSLLNQTVVPNIIVVNDGSFDNTLQKISKYKTLDNFCKYRLFFLQHKVFRVN